MFIQLRRGGYTLRHGEQFAQGKFLMVACGDDQSKLYAAVRYVSMKQLGQWMMGHAVVQGEAISVSGAYGNDGLPMDYDKFSDKVKAAFKPVPAELVAKFWQGGGHNSVGNEAEAMRAFGLTLIS